MARHQCALCCAFMTGILLALGVRGYVGGDAIDRCAVVGGGRVGLILDTSENITKKKKHTTIIRHLRRKS